VTALQGAAIDNGGTFLEQLHLPPRQDARQILEDSAMEIADFAGVLGHAGPSALARAFRRRSGTAFAQWRSSEKGRL
jgi:transcriptional regulator GlxA family with amidase domain